MFGVKLSYKFLWLFAAATGFGENWILRSFGLSVGHRMLVVFGLAPLLILLTLVCVFQKMALNRYQLMLQSTPSLRDEIN
jgi:hypothetical protein